MLKKLFLFALLVLFVKLSFSQLTSNHQFKDGDFKINFPSIVVQHINLDIELIPNTEVKELIKNTGVPEILVNGSIIKAELKDGVIHIPYKIIKKETTHIQIGGFDYSKTTSPIPLWMSILPPLIAIFMALLIREVFSALFVGILFGTTLIAYYQGSTIVIAIFQGLFTFIDYYVLETLSNHDHLSIILFSLLIGGMVNIISKNGGMKGVVNVLSKFAKSPRSGQLVTWVMGIAIFFDDYANTLVVGNTMRPVTDKLRVSREKLAYIVDSTAAPVASIAFITTWIGAEISYIQNGINTLNLDESAYNVFLNSLAYSFYPIFTLIFIFILVYRRVDYGPMLKAERKARSIGVTQMKDDRGSSNDLNNLKISDKIKPRWYNAVIPVMVIIFGTFAGLVYTGWDNVVWNDTTLGFSKKISTIIGNADSFKALLWSSSGSVLVAFGLTLGQRLLSLNDTIDSLVNGFRTMLTAIIILTLAWCIAMVTEHLHTADFISQGMLAMSISPYLIPTLTFVLAALIAFSTGSSWGTMAILYPLLLPASWLISSDFGLSYDVSLSIFHNVVSAVLAGSVLGDHCSPISDTTILSSLASNCNHIDHVRTQLPYALTVGFVAIIMGTLPAAYGISSWILFPAGILVLYLVIKVFGKKVNTAAVYK